MADAKFCKKKVRLNFLRNEDITTIYERAFLESLVFDKEAFNKEDLDARRNDRRLVQTAVYFRNVEEIQQMLASDIINGRSNPPAMHSTALHCVSLCVATLTDDKFAGHTVAVETKDSALAVLKAVVDAVAATGGYEIVAGCKGRDGHISAVFPTRVVQVEANQTEMGEDGDDTIRRYYMWLGKTPGGLFVRGEVVLELMEHGGIPRSGTGEKRWVVSPSFTGLDAETAQVILDAIEPLVVMVPPARSGKLTELVRIDKTEQGPRIVGNTITWGLDGKQAHNEFYPWLTVGVEQYLRGYMYSSAGALLMRGKPGTGKSTLVRTLAGLFDNADVYVVSSAVVIKDPLFLPTFRSQFSGGQGFYDSNHGRPPYGGGFRVHQPGAETYNPAVIPTIKRKTVLVIEDCPDFLRSRTDGNYQMSELLNLLDGVFPTEIKIVLTTNLDENNIDEALTRPGRCYDVFETRKLTFDQAKAARAAAGMNPDDLTQACSMTLAEATLPKPRPVVAGRVTSRFPISKSSIGFIG